MLEMSQEMYEMLEAVYTSEHYTPDPAAACLLLPAVDLLNTAAVEPALVATVLGDLPHWRGGRNHLILNMVQDGSLPTDRAILATSEHNNPRPGYGLTLPVLSPHNFSRVAEAATEASKRPHLVSYQHTPGATNPYAKMLSKYGREVALAVSGSGYPRLLARATFCLVPLPATPATLLMDCLAAGSIPVLVSPSPATLPLAQLLDWAAISLELRPSAAQQLVPLLRSLSPAAVSGLQAAGRAAYTRHLSSPAAVMLSSLAVLETSLGLATRPHPGSLHPSLPARPPNTGFTAVILTYNRVESLYQVISRVSEVESLVRIVVIWNHQTVPPPPAEQWPRVAKPLKVIQTSGNRLSNRFYPYPEIETECVLSMDDDISMLTLDELEFAYQVWREFPDRIVGFPSRTHTRDNSSGQVRYESEWTNDLSLVLTGVAFYHRYWHYTYTAAPSPQQAAIKQWVDEHINCEDIAFNMMVANATGKAPIKVGPRKKFKCSTPTCENSGMLSASASHLEERSSCLDKFVSMYGHNPLRRVEFRADPVLYKDKFPDTIKMYKDIGSL